jgi:amino acid adenylation domain-containing protein
MTLLAGWAALLMRLSGQQDLVIGAPVANRQRAEIEGLIGFFVNTLALRLNVSGSLTVRELLNQAKAQTLAAQQHQDIPFEQVVEIVQPPRSLAHSPLFQVMFAWEGAAASWPKMHGLEVTPLPTPSTAMTGFDLTLALRNEEDSIVGGIEYATSLFERTTIERYIGGFQKLLEAMAADENQMIGRLPLLGEGEYRQLVYGWNETAREFPRTKGVHELFEEQAEKNGEAPAVVYDDQQLSYGELNRRANRLAHYLRELGVGPDERVGICVNRSVEMFVAALGVLKAGGAYVPLDPEYPAERLRFMLEDSEPKVVLARGYLCGVVKELGVRVPIVDLGKEVEWGERPETNLQRVALKPEHLAYLIYTSGSTGQPKGVMIEHRAWCNLISQRVADLKVDHTSRASQFVSFSFDAWGEEAMTALCGGATLYVVGSTGGLQVEALSKIVTRHAITHVFLPPTILSGLQEQGGWASAGTLVVGGSRLSGETARRWGRGRRLINEYGPTEATVSATLHECRGDETNDPPIGRPIGNARIYILDLYREPVPVGVVGEIYIGGIGVARGYWKRPELTAERFMKDPFLPDPNARIYKTGDLGRWLADGNIEFLGRNDHQVKIRGFRIELDEIKARLVEHAGVREAAVIAREGATGEKRLVAYYTQTETSDGSVTELRADQLREHLSAHLPQYMVPAAYVRMETMPLTANGKLDRRALPEPEWDAYAVREYEAPVGEVEGTLAEIWSELLGVELVGRWDNFFELGGHSMLAVQVIAQVRERLGLEMDLRALFEAPTLATLATAVSPQANVLNVPPNRIAKVEQPADESVNDIEISI